MGAIKDTWVATIAAGQSLSGPVSVGDKELCGLLMPAAWTAAAISWQVSFDGGNTWWALYDDGGQVVKIAAPPAGIYMALDPSSYSGIAMLRVQSGLPGAVVNQVVAANLTLVTRKYFGTVR